MWSQDCFGLVPVTELRRGGVRQKTQFMVLSAAEPGRDGTFPCSCVSTHPKTTSAKTEMSYTKRVEQTAFKHLQLFPSFVSIGMRILKHCYLASFIQAELIAPTTSLPPIPTPHHACSKPLTDIPFPKRDNSFSQGYEHTTSICIVTVEEGERLINSSSSS